MALEVRCRVVLSRVGSGPRAEEEGECEREWVRARGVLRREREGYVRWRSVSVRVSDTASP